MRIRRLALALGVVAGLLVTQGTVARAETPITPANAQAAEACLAADNVWVVVEDQTGKQTGGCATEFTNGRVALISAGFTVTGTDFIESINGHPVAANHFWSYWNGEVDGNTIDWTFSQVGATLSTPQPGTVEGWHYVDWTAGPADAPKWPMNTLVPPNISTPVTRVLGDHTGDRVADIYAIDGQGRLQFFAGSTTGGLTLLGQVGTGWGAMTYITQVADVDGDGRSDLLARRGNDNSLWLFRSTGNGYLSAWKKVGQNWGGMDMIVPVGSLDGSSTQYVVARRASDGALFRYVMTPNGLTGIAHIGKNWNGMTQLLSVGDFTGDGRSDLLAIRGDGTLWMYAGAPGANIASGRQVGRGWDGFALAFSPGDLSGDGRPDLVGKRNDGTLFTYVNRIGSWSPPRQIATGTQAYTLMA
ncbi:FG-GAP-like repeat-containing protein [Propionibacteriaceae bacterium Y1923]